VGQPWHPDPGAHAEADAALTPFVDNAHHLVTGDDQVAPGYEVPLGQMEVGATDAAHAYPETQLTGSGKRDRTLDTSEGSGVDRPRHINGPDFHRFRHYRYLVVWPPFGVLQRPMARTTVPVQVPEMGIRAQA
jgi:hypothetical protein